MGKTVFIYDQCGEDDLTFFVLDGEFERMSGMYINNMKNDKQVEEELLSLLFNEDGDYNDLNRSNSFPYDAVKNGATVITIGFLP